MKNRILRICSVVALLLLTITITACGNKKDKPIATIEGFKIESIRVFHLGEGDGFNLEVGITNTNDEAGVFDFSQIILKLDGREISHNGDEQDYDANQYMKWSFQLDSGHGLNVGDTVEVYYGTQKLKNVKVVEF